MQPTMTTANIEIDSRENAVYQLLRHNFDFSRGADGVTVRVDGLGVVVQVSVSQTGLLRIMTTDASGTKVLREDYPEGPKI